MEDAVTVLRQEIANLEQDINKRHKALAVLTGSPEPMKRATAPVKRPAVSMKRPAPSRPTAPPATPPAAPGDLPLWGRVLAYLSENKGKLFSSADIAEALGKTDKSVKRDNVQRRLGDLFKEKKVRREDGRYGVAA